MSIAIFSGVPHAIRAISVVGGLSSRRVFAPPAPVARAFARSRFSRRPASFVSAAAATPGEVDKEAHNAEQAALRDEMIAGCTECTMPLEGDRAAALAAAALDGHTAADRGEGVSLRALVVGAETGKLADALIDRGASHVLVIDHSQAMLDRAAEAFDHLSVVGNEPGVRFLRCDVASVPAYQGPFDAVVFNDVLSHQADPADAIRRAALLARPGARVVVSERQDPEDASPDASPLDVGSIVADLPLEAASAARDGKAMNAAAPPDADAARVEDDIGGALWTFEVPPLYALRDAVTLAAPVVTGFGRGSRKMGVPTANLDPEALERELAGMHRGVYFGFARLPGDPKHAAWCKCVVNVGQRPTFADGDGTTVEVHALRDFGRDFYGEDMEVVVVGYVRPEMRFDGLQQLVARIMQDIGLARGALDDDACRGRVDAAIGFQTGDE